MKYLTTAEVGEIIRKTPEWVAAQCKSGHLKAVKLGNDWRVSEDALTLFMSGGNIEPARKRLSARQARRSA